MGLEPPAYNANVEVPVSPPEPLPFVKSATSAQEDPSNSSVKAEVLPPPKHKAAVVVPAPPGFSLPVFTSAISVQEDPFHCSTFV